VIVHIGAGNHNPQKEELYLSVLRDACLAGQIHLQGDYPNEEDRSLCGLVAAISVLENSLHTNAGVGSNLSLVGTVDFYFSPSCPPPFPPLTSENRLSVMRVS
jgi:taspase, threonine aspartase, 1